MKIAENVSQKNDECVIFFYKKIKGIIYKNKREFFIIKISKLKK